MLKFTLDYNCIIDLEENRPNEVFIRKIVEAWRADQIELAVVAVSASENQPSGKINRSFDEFENKLARLNLREVEYLLPLMIWDVFYWDHALWSNEEMEKLVNEIQNILFPGKSFDLPKDIELNSTWRNMLCDVLVAWSHVYHDWDILVTSDTNFHNKAEELKKVGINRIVYPNEAASLCVL